MCFWKRVVTSLNLLLIVYQLRNHVTQSIKRNVTKNSIVV